MEGWGNLKSSVPGLKMSRSMISSDSASTPTTGIILYLRVKSSHRNQALRLIEISMKHRKRMMMNSSDPDCGYRAEPADIIAQQPNIPGACTSSYHTLYEQPLPLPLFLTNCLSLLHQTLGKLPPDNPMASAGRSSKYHNAQAASYEDA